MSAPPAPAPAAAPAPASGPVPAAVRTGATGVPLGRHLWTLTLLTTGALHLGVAWSGWWSYVVLVAALLAAYGVTTLAHRIGAPGWLASGATLTAASLGAELVAARDGAAFGTALRDAFPRLLTAPRPAPPEPDLLVPGVVLVVVLAVWVAIRQQRDGGGPIAPVVSAVVLYVATALLTAGASDRHGWVAALLVVLAAAGWSAGRGRAGATRLAPVVAVVAGLALVGATLPTGPAFEPRELVAPPQLVLEEPSPLPRLAAWAQQADVELLTVTMERPLPLRLVTLTEFDGVTWRHPVAYRPFGAVAVPDLARGRRVAEITAEVTPTGLDGPWAPSPGRPTALDLADAHVDDASGTVALPGRLVAGVSYTVEAEVDDARAADVRDARVTGEPAVAPYLALPPLPADLAELARQVIRGSSTPLEQAVRIEAAVRDGRRFDPGAPAGSSYARLRTFLLGEEGMPGAGAGTSEQFATAFAVLARANGLPTRVVVGFRPDDQVEPGRWVVRGRDALAWPEVHLEGWGWVRFAPSPDTPDVGLDEQARDEVLDDLDRDRSEPEERLEEDPGPAPSPQPSEPSDTAGGPDAADAVTPALIALGVVTALPLLLLALRGRRRSRHRRAGARGAWSEVLDLAVLHDVPVDRNAPAPQVAAELARRWPMTGTHPASQLAVDADLAAFGPPGAASDVPGRFDHVAALRRRARADRPWWRQVASAFDPRPLRRR